MFGPLVLHEAPPGRVSCAGRGLNHEIPGLPVLASGASAGDAVVCAVTDPSLLPQRLKLSVSSCVEEFYYAWRLDS